MAQRDLSPNIIIPHASKKPKETQKERSADLPYLRALGAILRMQAPAPNQEHSPAAAHTTFIGTAQTEQHRPTGRENDRTL